VLRHDVLGGLHADAASGAAARSAGRPLAVAQLAAAAALLTGCGFLVRGALGIRATDPGFDTARLLTASVALPPALYPTDAARQALYQQLAARVSRMPGVVSVATTSVLPLDGGIGRLRIEVEGRSSPGDEAMQGSSKIVSASFAPTVGTRMIAGEAFRQGAAGVAMVNRAMARALWKTEPAAIGSRIRLNGGAWRTVVGVVSDVRQVLTVPPAPEVYVPMDASVPAALSLIVRTANDPMGIAPGLGTAVREANPDIALSGVWSMEMIVDGYFPAPFIAAFLGLSLIALFLSALGLYAMIAFRVASRGRELGIRAALGADPRRLLGLILRDGLRLTLLGLLLGGVVGAALGRLLASRFADVKVADPSLALAVAGVLGVVSVAACLLPARRATKVEPVVALRSE
jgi:predicted permease